MGADPERAGAPVLELAREMHVGGKILEIMKKFSA